MKKIFHSMILSSVLMLSVLPMTAQANEYHPGDKVPTSVDPDGFLPAPVTYDAGPTCVEADERGSVVHVRNACKADERVKVLVAFGKDSGCTSLKPGDSFDHSLEPNIYRGDLVAEPRFDGIELC